MNDGAYGNALIPLALNLYPNLQEMPVLDQILLAKLRYRVILRLFPHRVILIPEAQGQGQHHPFHPQHFAFVQIQTTTVTGGMVLNLVIAQ